MSKKLDKKIEGTPPFSASTPRGLENEMKVSEPTSSSNWLAKQSKEDKEQIRILQNENRDLRQQQREQKKKLRELEERLGHLENIQNISKGTSETLLEETEEKKAENPVVPEKKSDDPTSHYYDDFVYYKETERTTVLLPKHVKQAKLHIINKITRPDGDEAFIVLDALVLNANQYNYWQEMIHRVYKKAHEKFEIEKQGAGKCELMNSCCFCGRCFHIKKCLQKELFEFFMMAFRGENPKEPPKSSKNK